MKKLFIPVMLLLAIFGCNRSATNSNEVDVESYTLNDSVFIESDFGDDYSYYFVNIELPVTNNKTLRQNIIHWIVADENEDYKTYFEKDRDRFFAEEGDEPRSSFLGNFTLSEQTDLYVTYISEGYIYTGGAHPLPWYYGTSFSKTDGSIVGYDMFDDPEQLRELISENINKQYFEKYDAENDAYFFNPDEPFQLPTNEPWIETDSVVFCYGPYEIAPYAAGIPLCKISKSELLPYLNEKGKSILK